MGKIAYSYFELDDVAKSFLPLNRLDAGKGEKAIPARCHKGFIVPSLVRFPASAQCRSVSAESSFEFRLFSSNVSNRNAEDPVTCHFL